MMMKTHAMKRHVNETVNFDYTNKQISASFETFSIHVPYIRFLADIWDVKYYLD